MASPVSFGDAYQMAKLAYRLGHAFTKGRKSAPAEFREVESQLYSLSTALGAIHEAIDKGVIGLPDETSAQSSDTSSTSSLLIVMKSCQETLSHLDKITKRYGCLSDEKSQGNERTSFRRWSKEVQRNWRKVLWTTEGGDLATLRSQLTLHTNSLGLVMGVINQYVPPHPPCHACPTKAQIPDRASASNLQTSVSESSSMLQEIYQWFLENLKNAKSIEVVDQGLGGQHRSPPSRVYFSLQAEGFSCSRATFVTDQATVKLSENTSKQRDSLFRCQCLSPTISQDARPHEDQVSALTCLKWFEEDFVNKLGLWKACDLLQQGRSTILAHLSPNQQNIRILNVIGDVSTLPVHSVTFFSGEKTLTEKAVESVKLLHYKNMPIRSVRSSVVTPKPEESFENKAELVIFYNTDRGSREEISQSVISCTSVGSLETTEGCTSFKLKRVNCTTIMEDTQSYTLDEVEILLSFNNFETAKSFRMKVEEMRVELFAINLEHPRPDENVVLQLQADEVSCDDFHIEDAAITVVSQPGDRYRLIVRSRNGCTTLSQQLAQDFMSSWTPGNLPKFSSQTDVIQLTERGQGIFRTQTKKKTLGHLHLSVANGGDRLLDMGLATLVQSSPQQALSATGEENTAEAN
ncbi:hypothetical protein NPX13_g2600 [Xylaria arbuscula]|uniref:Fungal N-terminal domain-containing protein n=1 Tax=Xylaria arbuscula TaxID=114810 RepID=A0A9W8NJB6_9PEZI|nr:hypothetical protein NPX13_g2600 [Xylaria arbuscula]